MELHPSYSTYQLNRYRRQTMTFAQKFDRESAIEYCLRNDHVVCLIKQTMNREYLSSLDAEQLQWRVRLIKSFIRDFPNDYQER